MNKIDPHSEVLNDNMEFLIDYLMRELRCLGKKNGLSNSQLIYMEREFIARLAFAAIIGDDEKEPEKTFPDDVWKALSFIKDYCLEHDCDDCIFHGLDECNIKYTPNEWRI